jgi:hypothetical protein
VTGPKGRKPRSGPQRKNPAAAPLPAPPPIESVESAATSQGRAQSEAEPDLASQVAGAGRLLGKALSEAQGPLTLKAKKAVAKAFADLKTLEERLADGYEPPVEDKALGEMLLAYGQVENAVGEEAARRAVVEMEKMTRKPRGRPQKVSGETVRAVKRMRDNGASYREIRRTLSLPSDAAVKAILKQHWNE